MFTGLVEEVGSVAGFVRYTNAVKLTIKAKKVLEDCKTGDSIAINGVCQTVTSCCKDQFSVDVLQESLAKTNLGSLKYGSKVNLEPALTPTSRMGGHIVQGHVQGTGRVSNILKSGENTFLTVWLERELMQYMVKEGSITVDGLSLTIASISSNTVTINIIPHTLENTTINEYKVGRVVNIEPDILIKANISKKEVLTKEKLLEWGY